MNENNLKVGQYSNDENVFLEDVIINDFENWTSEDFIDNMPKILDTSYLKIFWCNNKWYTCYNENIIESDTFLEDSIRKMYDRINKNVK